jgi:uncharacterized caspase-like protein
MTFYQLLILSFLLCLNTAVFSQRGLIITQAAEKNKRIALVIGNSAYQSSPLKNPVNDARAMAKVLKKNGFDVILKINAQRRQMQQAINEFGQKLKAGGIGFFYYAGHGIQIDGRNYLIPVNITIESESDVKYEAVDAGRVLGKMHDADNALNVVIMDACRNNPFSRSFRSAEKGLAKMDAPTGTIIAYATSPGSVAADGDDTNGLYTKYLLKYLDKPQLKIEDVFKKVRIAVVNDSDKKQVPWESSSLIGNFIFNINTVNISTTANKQAEAEPGNIQVEDEFWALIRDSSNLNDFNDYLQQYPNGKYNKLAQFKIKKIIAATSKSAITLMVGEWEAWQNKAAKSQISKQSDGSILWSYSVPKGNITDDAGLYVSIDELPIKNKKIRLKFSSKFAFPIDLSIYAFVPGYSKEDDFDTLVMADFRLNLKVGYNEFIIDSEDFIIPEWWLEEQGNPSVSLLVDDVRGLEFNIELESGFGSPSDSLKIYAIEIIE